MAKNDFYPKEGVVYECYRGFTDRYGDRARKGQLFVLYESWEDYEGDGIIYHSMAKKSGKGINILISIDDFMKHFCPADETKMKTPAPKDDWEEVRFNFSTYPPLLQKLLLIEKPDLFPTEPIVFEFKENQFHGGLPFMIGKGLVETEDEYKCLVMFSDWEPEIFTSKSGCKCVRFIKK